MGLDSARPKSMKNFYKQYSWITLTQSQHAWIVKSQFVETYWFVTIWISTQQKLAIYFLKSVAFDCQKTGQIKLIHAGINVSPTTLKYQ